MDSIAQLNKAIAELTERVRTLEAFRSWVERRDYNCVYSAIIATRHDIHSTLSIRSYLNGYMDEGMIIITAEHKGESIEFDKIVHTRVSKNDMIAAAVMIEKYPEKHRLYYERWTDMIEAELKANG